MLEVTDVSGLATLQDTGRFGWRRFGVPLAGPVDRFAFDAANLLVGNPPGTTALELGGGDIVLRAQWDCLVAVTGVGYELSVNQYKFPLWGAYFVRSGWSMHLTRSGFGMWAYVALAGGFSTPSVLGSCSTYLRGRFGGFEGRPIQPGDVLRSASYPHVLLEFAGQTVSPDAIPAYGPSPTVDVIAGPHAHLFTDGDRSDFFSNPYRVSPASDRMGYRLEGHPLRGAGSSEVVSQGMSVGSLQVPAGGQPIAMLADCATTGGYPILGCVTSASLPLLAQCTPGQDEVRFREVTVETAQGAYREMTNRLRQGIIMEDYWQTRG